jgi:hypothetical protein
MKRHAIGQAALLMAWTFLGASVVGAERWPLKGIYGYNSTYTQWSKGAGEQLFANTQVLNNADVDGIAVKVAWNVVEAADGVYTWNEVDSVVGQVAAVGKKVTLDVVAGFETPAWIFSEGAQGFNFVWDVPWGPSECSIVTIPVPWSAIYLEKLEAMIQAMGAHYNSNPTVTGVKIAGINSTDEETTLPYLIRETISNGRTKCTGYDNVANWQAVGYTRLLVESAWEQIAGTYYAAFPNKALIAILNPGGFPPIDDNGATFVTSAPAIGQDQQASVDIIAAGASAYGEQFGLQYDGLISWGQGWSTEASYAEQIITGYQTASALGASLSKALTIATNAQADYLELYAVDINNASLMATIASARAALQ